MGEPIPPAIMGQCCFQRDVGKPPSFPQRWHAYPALGSEANGPPVISLLDDVVRVAGGSFQRANGGTLTTGGLAAAFVRGVGTRGAAAVVFVAAVSAPVVDASTAAAAFSAFVFRTRFFFSAGGLSMSGPGRAEIGPAGGPFGLTPAGGVLRVFFCSAFSNCFNSLASVRAISS